jgi:hypothetical protein
MKHSIIKVGILAVALATMVACGKKGADGASVNTARDQRAAGPSLLPTGQGGTAGTQSAPIVMIESMKAQTRDAVQVLVSPTMDPQAVGDIISIMVKGMVGIQSNGVFTPDSGLELIITDSYVGTTQDGATIDPITIRLRGNVAGTINFPQSANVSFTDEYGTITISGTFANASQQNPGTFTGRVDFQNKTAVNGKSGGTLGQFSIPTCAFFRCQ